MVSIMPGIDIAEPERTETSSGLSARTEALAGLLFQRRHVGLGRLPKPVGQVALVQVGEAGLGRDHEARRHVEADLRHLAQVGALAAQQHLVLAVAFVEGIDILLDHVQLP